MPFTLSMGITVDAERAPGRRVEVVVTDRDELDAFDLDAVTAPGPGDWRAYVRGTLAELDRRATALPGMRMRIAADLPAGVGLASSAALEAALALAALRLAGHDPDRIGLAAVLREVEAGWAGVPTGPMDQLCVLLGTPGAATMIDTGTLRMEPVPLGGARFGGMHTGARRLATGYAARLSECAQAARLLGLPDLRDATPASAAALPDPLGRRVRHVVEENARVRVAASALAAGDLRGLGAVMDESHASLRDLFEVSTPALEAAHRRSHREGALGARVSGAGFGGMLVALWDRTPPEGWIDLRPGPAAAVEPAG